DLWMNVGGGAVYDRQRILVRFPSDQQSATFNQQFRNINAHPTRILRFTSNPEYRYRPRRPYAEIQFACYWEGGRRRFVGSRTAACVHIAQWPRIAWSEIWLRSWPVRCVQRLD